MPLLPRSPMHRFRALPVMALGVLVAWTPVRAVNEAEFNFGAPPGRLTIARVQYEGGGDWYANPSSLPNLLAAIAERTALPVERTEAKVRLTDSSLFDFPFLHLTGHGEMKF